MVEFGEWFLDELALTVPHRHIVFSIPKLIRRCFLYNRTLLAELSRVAWETLKEFMSGTGVSIPGCACSIQTFGDFLGFNPHCHIIITDGSFDDADSFHVISYYDTFALQQLFRHKVLTMLLDKGAITQWHIDLLMSWQHSGFNVHVGDPIAADDRQGLEKLAYYVIRCQFSQERMTYLEDTHSVIYRSKDGHTTKSFAALEWLAMIVSHIPKHGEQMVRYYGYYSNVSRGKRRKLGMDDAETPVIAEVDADTPYRKKCRANWARLIQKIYEIDPLVCPKCNGTMRVISFIEEAAVIRKILEHLGLWVIPPRQPRQGRGPPVIVDTDAVMVYADSLVIEYEEAYYIPEYL